MQGNLAASGAKPAGFDWIARIAALPLADSRAEAIAILVLIPLSLGVAFWNGFPIIFYDTGAYLLEGLGRRVSRRTFAGLFALARLCRRTRKPLVRRFASSRTTAFVMVETARAIAPRIVSAASCGHRLMPRSFTGLPWYVGQIEPDCFAAIAVLSLYLLAFHGAMLEGWRNWLLVAVACARDRRPSVASDFGGYLLQRHPRLSLVLRIAKAEGWPPARIAEPVIGCMMGLA